MRQLIPNGTRVNQYRIDKHLGSGLFADVYLAKHIYLNVDRAIKVLSRSDNAPELFTDYASRYKQEWQLAAGIHHNNLIQVYDLFEKDDTLFAVVEYAPEGTLQEKFAEHATRGDDWVVGVIRDCANGLMQIHQLKKPELVHCFVNPKTIVFNEIGQAKITNYGRAASIFRQNPQYIEPYDTLYQAPELSEGIVAPTSDIYSLGCVAFEMLTLKQYASACVRSPKQMNPRIPEWLDRVVVRMVSADPCLGKADEGDCEKRYLDMQQLLQDLDREQYQPTLRDKIVAHFDMDGLKTLVDDLGVDPEAIRGSDKTSYAREMITYFNHREGIKTLRDGLKKVRENVQW